MNKDEMRDKGNELLVKMVDLMLETFDVMFMVRDVHPETDKIEASREVRCILDIIEGEARRRYDL